MRLLPGTLLALTLGLSCAAAQDTRSTAGMLSHCMAGLAADSQDPLGGRCQGILATLSFVSRVLLDNLKFCHPNNATPQQMMQVITSFVEANPDAGVQDFRLVALAAMRDKWPCQE